VTRTLNYLAHLFLAGPDGGHRIGALLGDFMRGQELDSYPRAVQDGVLHHRVVDQFTDSHPVFRRSCRRLASRYRRFGGVIIDVFYDHFLARSWHRWSAQPLPVFTSEVYSLLQRNAADLPPRMQRAIGFMIADDWLASYAEIDKVDLALQGLGKRVRRDNPLGDAVGELSRLEESLESDFEIFFPQIIERSLGEPRSAGM